MTEEVRFRGRERKGLERESGRFLEKRRVVEEENVVVSFGAARELAIFVVF